MLVTKRTSELIRLLDLQPHPEGGYFSEIFRSGCRVRYKDSLEERSALTSIYYLLVAGQHSQWHRIKADEIWHHYEGAPLQLVWAGTGVSEKRVLGPVGEKSAPVAVVPGGCWQAARTLGEYTLIGCSVGPGFEYSEFELLRASEKETREFRARHPDLWERVRAWAGNDDRD
ncbi:cupin domain-containing protein [candidate division KSB1 bacterium]|nr:cupin domain-containing protein [candidate division KSB1 bacterium]